MDTKRPARSPRARGRWDMGLNKLYSPPPTAGVLQRLRNVPWCGILENALGTGGVADDDDGDDDGASTRGKVDRDDWFQTGGGGATGRH